MPKRPKKVSYKPGPMIKAITKRNAEAMAAVPEVMSRVSNKLRAMRMHIRGMTHDRIAQRLGITTQEAHELIKERIKEWIQSESFDPAEMREVVAKRYDGALGLAMKQAFPHPEVDEFGRPVMGNICRCELGIDGSGRDEKGRCILCSLPGHTAQKISSPDVAWLRVYLEILQEQKKMFGLDAADKMEKAKVDLMERVYRGVDAKVIQEL